jgi:hypothetical protein
MSEEQNPRDWIGEFQIQSSSDLDFVIGQQVGCPIGMTRSSPPEFRRRVLAAAISHQLGLRSIDYAMKRYVKSDQYEGHKTTIGDSTSDFLREAAEILKDELKQLHTQENLTFGRFGAEITLFKFPEILDLARMLANRGLFLEVLPILRLCLEMTAWSVVSFDTSDEEAVRRLKAHKCVPRIKAIYESAGQVYGYLSRFAHWDYAIHSYFLKLEGENIATISASCQHRAMSLMLCLVVLDIFLEAIRHIYLAKSDGLIVGVQGESGRTSARKTHQLVATIVEFSGSLDFREIQLLLR